MFEKALKPTLFYKSVFQETTVNVFDSACSE